MNREIPAPPIGPSNQAARELAYRRWRPGTAPSDTPGASASPSPASVLALQRWRPTPEPQPVAVGTRGTAISDEWGNVAIFAILCAVAAAIYFARRSAGAPAVDSGARAAGPNHNNWSVWLLAGVLALGALLLLCSRAARRNWGVAAGLALIALAALPPPGRGLSAPAGA
ncbi:MAG: hypothetical protein ACRD2E_01565 [Terriglobales bacterium]